MIDLHNHLLWGLDDGAPDAAATQEMLQAAKDVGIAEILATPHLFHPSFPRSTAETVRLRLADPGTELLLPVWAGGEHYLCAGLIDTLLTGVAGLLPLPGNRHILLELGTQVSPMLLDHLLPRLGTLGLSPILAHPERYNLGSGGKKTLENLAARGFSFQLNARSLVGRHGRDCQHLAFSLIDRGLARLVASDAHSARDILVHYPAARVQVERQWGPEAAYLLFDANPWLALRGRPLLDLDQARRAGAICRQVAEELS